MQPSGMTSSSAFRFKHVRLNHLSFRSGHCLAEWEEAGLNCYKEQSWVCRGFQFQKRRKKRTNFIYPSASVNLGLRCRSRTLSREAQTSFCCSGSSNWSISQPAERYHVSSVSRVCPRAFFCLDMAERHPQGGIQKASWSGAWTASTGSSHCRGASTLKEGLEYTCC